MTRTSSRAAASILLVLASLAAVAGVSRGESSVPVQTTVVAEADAHDDSGRPGRNFGAANRLRVAAESPEHRSFLRFDVAGLSGPVVRATLRVRVATASSRGFDVRGVESTTWSESSLTYRNAPPFSATVTERSGAVSSGAWVTVDVTPLVLGPGRVSFALTRSAITATAARAGSRRGAAAKRSRRAARRKKRARRGGRRVRARAAETALTLYSRETASRPQLVVETGSEPAPPPPPADVTPPAVALTAPAAGATVSGTVAVTADAIDAGGVARVEFLADGRAIATDTSAPFTADWDTRTVDDGSRTLTARAVDAAGNEAVSEPRTVTVANAAPPDTTAPDTSIQSGPRHTYRSGIAQFAFSADESGVTFECSLDDAAYRACAPGDVFHVANGSHELRVRARDAAGNVDPSPATRTWWADATAHNGTFETATAGWLESDFTTPGWKGYLSTISIGPGGVAGARARVAPLPGESFYSAYTAPRPVNATVAGRVYTGRAHVRSDQPGKTVCLEVVERATTGIVGSAVRCVTTTSAWQPVPDVALTARGGNELYVVLGQDGAVTGDSFDLDGVEITDGTPLSVGPVDTPPGPPRLLAFGDIGFCDSSGDEAMARLVDTLPGTIAMLGDLEQRHASAAEFDGCFLPAWGRHLSRTRPAVGDHEYRQPGAGPYWDALGERAGERGKGWYSYDLGSWHIVVLNSNCTQVGGCGPGSEQYEWLERDLAANATSCVGAYFHHPRFSSGNIHGSQDRVAPFWDVLYRYSAEFVLGGNDANYQRFAPQTPGGALDRERGIRQFVAGTGGTIHYAVGAPLPNTEVQHSGTFGALELTLGDASYDWRFVPQEGRSFTDTGSQACSPLPRPDTTPPTVRLTAPSAGDTLEGTARMTADASDDEGIDRVEFRAGDRVLASDTSEPYAADVDLSFLAAGEHTLTAVASDRSGNTATSDPVAVTVTVPAPPPNLLANPGFESGLTGWSGYRATLTRVAGGAEGSHSARVAYGGTGSSFSVITSPVAATAAGTAYRAGAWVRSAIPGRRVCLRLREMGSSGAIGAAETCVTATTGWTQFPAVSYTATGGARLDLYAYQGSPAAGDEFDLDDVSLTSG